MTAWTTYATHHDGLNNTQRQQQRSNLPEAHNYVRGRRAWLIYEDEDGRIHLQPQYARRFVANDTSHLPLDIPSQFENRPSLSDPYIQTNSSPDAHQHPTRHDHTTQPFANRHYPDPGPSGSNRPLDVYELTPPLSIRRLSDRVARRYSYSNDQPEEPHNTGESYQHSQHEESFLFQHPGSVSPGSNHLAISQTHTGTTLHNDFVENLPSVSSPNRNENTRIDLRLPSSRHHLQHHPDVDDSGYFEENSREFHELHPPNPEGLFRNHETTSFGVDEIRNDSTLLSRRADRVILDEWLSSVHHAPRYPRVTLDPDIPQLRPRHEENSLGQVQPTESTLRDPDEQRNTTFPPSVTTSMSIFGPQNGDPNSDAHQTLGGTTPSLPSVVLLNPDGLDNEATENRPSLQNLRGILQRETTDTRPSAVQHLPASRRITWDPAIPLRPNENNFFHDPAVTIPAIPMLRSTSVLHGLIVRDRLRARTREREGVASNQNDTSAQNEAQVNIQQAIPELRFLDDSTSEQRMDVVEFTEAEGVRWEYIMAQRRQCELSGSFQARQTFKARSIKTPCSYCNDFNCYWRSRWRYRPYTHIKAKIRHRTESQKQEEIRRLERKPYLISRRRKQRFHSDRSMRTINRRNFGVGNKRSHYMPWNYPVAESFVPWVPFDPSKWKDLPTLPSSESWSRMFPTPETRKWMPVPPFPVGEDVVGFPKDPPNLEEMRNVDVDLEEACPSLNLFDPTFIAAKQAKQISEEVVKYKEELVRVERPKEKVWRKAIREIGIYISSAKQLSLSGTISKNSTIQNKKRLSIRSLKLSLFKSFKVSKDKGLNTEISQNPDGLKSTATLSTLSIGIFTPTSRPSTPIQTPPSFELNPLLRHDPHTPTRSIIWRVSLDPCMALYPPLDPTAFLTNPPVIPINDVYFHGPATIPPITKMKIDKLADFPLVKCLKLNSKFIPKRKRNGEAEVELRSLPWPMIIHGTGEGGVIRVIDIYKMIYENFSLYITQEEFALWGKEKQRALTGAFEQRREWERDARAYWLVDGQPAGTGGDGVLRLEPLEIPEKGVMRREWLGERVMFRGVEKSPDGDGWTLFIGSSMVTSADACIFSKKGPLDDGQRTVNVEVV